MRAISCRSVDGIMSTLNAMGHHTRILVASEQPLLSCPPLRGHECYGVLILFYTGYQPAAHVLCTVAIIL